jgi:hypothetical protein
MSHFMIYQLSYLAGISGTYYMYLLIHLENNTCTSFDMAPRTQNWYNTWNKKQVQLGKISLRIKYCILQYKKKDINYKSTSMIC